MEKYLTFYLIYCIKYTLLSQSKQEQEETMMGKYIIQKCSGIRPWSHGELSILQELSNNSLYSLTRRNMRAYQRENTLWVVREVEQKTILGVASLTRVHTLDPSQTFGILHSVKLCKAFDDDPYLEKKLRRMMIKEIIDYASKKKLQYIQVATIPGEKKASDLYPGVGFVRVAHSSNAIHGTHFDHLYIFAKSA